MLFFNTKKLHLAKTRQRFGNEYRKTYIDNLPEVTFGKVVILYFISRNRF